MPDGAVIIDDNSGGGVELFGFKVKIGRSVAFALLSGTRMAGLTSAQATATLLGLRMTELAAGPFDADRNEVLLRAPLLSVLTIRNDDGRTIRFEGRDNTIRIDASDPMQERTFVLGDSTLFYYYRFPDSAIASVDVDDNGHLDRPKGVNSLGAGMTLL